MTNTKKRKLRAILFADIVGYTSLMQKDEAHASILLQKFRNTLNAEVAMNEGKVINNYGDGCLCTFESAVDAVKCAKELQLIFQKEPIVPVRIGLHSGDVFFEEDNVFGDSVNIAARIESLGVAGAVLFSKQIKRHIANQAEFKVQSLGAFDFKNVEKTMEVFGLANEGLIIPNRNEIKGKLKQKKFHLLPWLIGSLLLLLSIGGWYYSQQTTQPKAIVAEQTPLKSIGVLPFKNLSGDNGINYFGAGIREEITTQLIGIQALEVFSSEVVNQFNAANMSMLDFGQQKGIAHLLLGSVRMDEQQNRIVDTKLLDTHSGKYLWAATFSEKELAVTAFQKEIIQKIIDGLQLKLSLQAQTIVKETMTDNAEAYELYLKASQYHSFNGDSIRKHRIVPLQKCIQLDSNFHQAYTGLAAGSKQLAEFSLEPPLPNWRAAKGYIRKAINLAPNNANALNILGQIQKNFEWDFKAAEQTFLKAIALDPKQQGHYIFYLMTMGQPQKGLQQRLSLIEKFAEFKEEGDVFLAFLYSLNQQFDKANQIVDALDSISLNQIGNFTHFYTAEHYAFQGNSKKAIEYYEKSISNEAILSAYKGYQLAKSGNRKAAEQIKSRLLLLAKTARVSPLHFAALEIGLGNLDAAFEQLELAYQQNDSLILVLPVFSPYHDAAFRADPRYAALLKKIGLK